MTELDGFTLFKTSKGWQLSTRAKGESGWSVRFVSQEAADRLFSCLPDVGHVPQGRTLSAPTSPMGRLALEPPRRTLMRRD